MPETTPQFRAGWRDAMTLFEARLDLLILSVKKDSRKVTMKDIKDLAAEHRKDVPLFTR